MPLALWQRATKVKELQKNLAVVLIHGVTYIKPCIRFIFHLILVPRVVHNIVDGTGAMLEHPGHGWLPAPSIRSGKRAFLWEIYHSLVHVHTYNPPFHLSVVSKNLEAVQRNRHKQRVTI